MRWFAGFKVYASKIIICCLVVYFGWRKGQDLFAFFGISVSENAGHIFGLVLTIALIFSAIVILRYFNNGAMSLTVGPDEE